jgi:polyisoprenoid-binding protein YceI
MPALTNQATLVPPGTWEVDPARSIVGFSVRHLLVTKVRGRFGDFAGTIRCDSRGVASIDGRVAVASIDTGDPRRDARLCTAEFFDVARHPTITLSAVTLPVRSGDAVDVRGILKVRDESAPLTLQVESPVGDLDEGAKRRICASGVVSRRELGLEWDSAFAAGGLVIDDRVALQFDVVVG